MAETNTKAALDKLLADRRPALEALASAHAQLDKARRRRLDAEQAERDAGQRYREAHRAATAAGWGARELADVGYPSPTARTRDARRRGNRTTTAGTSTSEETNHDQHPA